jgi:hypothetical protein
MKNHTYSRVAEQKNIATQHKERAAERDDTASSAMVDNRAFALTIQRLQDMTNSSQKTMQLKQNAQLMSDNFSAKTMRHFAQMAENSARPAQLERQAGVITDAPTGPVQQQERPNNTGLPDQLKSGIESLSGISMDNVKVHYNSDKPAQLQAHAYAQGTEIHLAAGQEKHLPHEAWHIVQQAQGRVGPTLQMNSGVQVNDDFALESEADLMGARAGSVSQTTERSSCELVAQRKKIGDTFGSLQQQHAIRPKNNEIIQRISTEDGRIEITFTNSAENHGYTKEQLERIILHRLNEIAIGNRLTLPIGAGTEDVMSRRGHIIYNCSLSNDTFRIHVFHAHGAQEEQGNRGY